MARRSSTSKTSRKTAPRAKATPADGSNLLLRGVDARVLEVLRAKAAKSGRSLQTELHAALRRGLNLDHEGALAISNKWHEHFKGRPLPDTTEMLREDRAR